MGVGESDGETGTDDAEAAGAADGETPLQGLAAGVVTFTTLAVAFGLLAVDWPYFWIAFPLGFGGGMPLALAVARWYESRRERGPDRDSSGESETDAALADLRRRYARGEFDDEEFEVRVERLLETESIPDAKTFAEREPTESGGTGAEAASTEENEREPA